MSLLDADIELINMINSDYIRSYCLAKFKDNYRLSSNEIELIIPSVFIEDDYKRHMSINLESGLWRCFKTGATGNFIKLYSTVEKIPYKQAYQKFLFESLLNDAPKTKPEKLESVVKTINTDEFELVDLTKIYDELVMALACEFIHNRGMANHKFYVCRGDSYKDRLIIPFFNNDGKIFFFQARALSDRLWPKYLNCEAFKSSHVLYPFDYESNEPLFITEGVFDCLSLKNLGYNATTTLSCHTSKEQMAQLKQYSGPLVCCFDRDEAGEKGRNQFMKLAHRMKISNIKYATPDYPYKDWNEQYLSGFHIVTKNTLTYAKELSNLNLSLSKLE